jgi:hypothetical protein
MTYLLAELRLRRALILLLVGGNTIPVQSLFGRSSNAESIVVVSDV